MSVEKDLNPPPPTAIAAHYFDPPPFSAFGPPYQPTNDAAKLNALQSVVGSDLGTWIDHLRRAGITADRRNSPHLFDQFAQTLRRPTDTVICSVLDADPSACLG